MRADENVPLAAVRFRDWDQIDALLEQVTRYLQRQGLVVGGFLQRETPAAEGCCSIMHLENIATGETLQISQNLGRGSRGCRLDPAALAELSGRLLPRISGYDLLVLNRYGKGESEGGGFRQMICAAADAGVPVLTAVRNIYDDSWTAFTGGVAHELPLGRNVVTKWCLDRAGSRPR